MLASPLKYSRPPQFHHILQLKYDKDFLSNEAREMPFARPSPAHVWTIIYLYD